MSRLLFCTAKIVNVDKNAESQDEMRKNGSILNGVDDDFSHLVSVATIKAKSKMLKNVAIKNVSVQIYNFSLF